jgi:hypothetical protein
VTATAAVAAANGSGHGGGLFAAAGGLVQDEPVVGNRAVELGWE